MNGLALCPGVGGLELGLELALGPAFRTVAYVEREAFVAGVLAARMQDGDLAPAPIWDDVRTFDGRAWRGRVDLVSAGFPCQPHSQAGNRGGAADDRWLWHDIRRIVSEVAPGLIVLENVRGLLSSSRALAFGEVLADLARLGYLGAWRCLRAADVGAPHRRDRVFVLAATPDAVDWLRFQRGRTGRQDGQAATGPGTDGTRGRVADSDGSRRQGTERTQSPRRGARSSGSGGDVPDPDDGGSQGERITELRGLECARGDLAHGRGGGGQWGPDGAWAVWEAEPNMGRVVAGVAAGVDLAGASRRDRLRATGNGCVPQQAAVAIRSLMGAL